jgi:hypothetical protein
VVIAMLGVVIGLTRDDDNDDNNNNNNNNDDDGSRGAASKLPNFRPSSTRSIMAGVEDLYSSLIDSITYHHCA